MQTLVETRFDIHGEHDVVTARQDAYMMAMRLGCSSITATLIATAISEVGRNIQRYAGHGTIDVAEVTRNGRCGITIVASDDGPGIADVDLAMKEGYSTCNSLGLGLPGCAKIMDEFDVASEAGHGTVVTMTKWRT